MFITKIPSRAKPRITSRIAIRSLCGRGPGVVVVDPTVTMAVLGSDSYQY
jgi:hypothetical protein